MGIQPNHRSGFLRRGRVAIENADFGAGAGNRNCNRAANAASTACDKRDAAGERTHARVKR